MTTESTPSQTAAPNPAAAAKPFSPQSPVLHRVCIQCNNMFTVTPDKYDAKQCPACHKG
jgi:hypothetical protein